MGWMSFQFRAANRSDFPSTDSSATEVPMIINEPYSPLMNSSTSNEYKALNRKITAAVSIHASVVWFNCVNW